MYVKGFRYIKINTDTKWKQKGTKNKMERKIWYY